MHPAAACNGSSRYFVYVPVRERTGLALSDVLHKFAMPRTAVALELRRAASRRSLPMQKTLPKGHTSCLSPQFKYTSATHTDLGKTFARIKRQLKGQSKQDRAKVCPLPARKAR